MTRRQPGRPPGITLPEERFPAEMQRILGGHAVARTFAAGELLWREGDVDGMLVSLVEGQVKIFRVLPGGSSATSYIFGAGDVFGFMPLLDDAPYPACAQAIGPVRARVVTRAGLREAVRGDPDLALLLLKQLSRRLREAFDHIEVLSSRGVVRKVAMALTALLADETRQDGAAILTLPVASGEFANLYGLTPESFSRGITELVDGGVIHRLGINSFQVLKPAALREQAQSSTF